LKKGTYFRRSKTPSNCSSARVVRQTFTARAVGVAGGGVSLLNAIFDNFLSTSNFYIYTITNKKYKIDVK